MKKILAIDDQKDNLTIIKAVLSSQLPDIKILTALSGSDGVDIAIKEQPDTIILDIIMPSMDGYEVCIKLKENIATRHIPIIMLTAIQTDSNSRIKGLTLGADAFLSKPIDPLELSTQVIVMLRIKEAEDKLRFEKNELENLVQMRTNSLTESKEKYRALYDNVPLPYQALTEVGIFRDVNPAWLDGLGYKRDEVIGKKFVDFLHPSLQEHFKKNFKKFKERGSISNVEFKIKHKKGNYIDIIFEGCIGYNPDGSFNQTYCVFQDITDKKKAEKSLEENELYFRTLIENSSDVIIIIDIDGNLIFESQANDLITGYAGSELMNKNLFQFVHPDDINNVLSTFKILVKEPNTVENISFRVKHKSGIWKDIEGTGKNMLHFPRINGIVFNYRDITQNKIDIKLRAESDRKLQTLINNLQGIVYRCKNDSNWSMDYLSKRFEEITGYKVDDIIHNKKLSFDDIIVPEDRARVWDEIQDAVKRKAPYTIKYNIITASKEVIYVLENGEAIYDNDKKNIIGLEGYISDITSEVKVKEELKGSEELIRSITHSAADAIVAIDSEGKVFFWNTAAEKIFGYTTEEMINNTLSKIIPDKYQSQHFSKIEKHHNEEKDKSVQRIIQITAIRKDGDEFPIELSLSSWQKNNKKYFTGIIRDISERIRAEKELKKLSTAVEQSPSIIAITNTEGIIDYVNPKFTQLTGYKIDEAVGQKSNILKSGHQSEEEYSTLWENISSGKEWRGEFHNKKKDGSYFWESAAISPILDKDGKTINYIKVAEDITDKKIAQEALKESESKYQKLIETSSEGFWLIDTEGITLDVNISLCNMLGYSKDEMIGNKPYDFADEYNKDIFQNQISKANSKAQRIYEVSLLTKSGESIPALFNATSIADNNGKFAGSFAFVSNISEQKRSEHIQKVLYNISNAVMTTTNLKNLIELIQKELGEIIDTKNFFVALYDKETNMLSLPFYTDEKDEIVTLPAGKSLTDYVIKTKKSLLVNREGKKRLEKEGFIERFGSDSKIWLGVPLKIENEVIGALVVQNYTDESALDASDMKLLEFVSDQVSISINRKKDQEDVLFALNKSTESDRLKTAFLQNISHEIRTPMNGIMGFTSLLKDTEISGEERQSYLDVIMISGKRMLNTLNDLMDISMLETDQVKINICDTNINEELIILHDFFKLEVEKKGMSISYSTELQHNDAIIKTDREKFYAVLSNLIKNAIKYSHKGSINFGYTIKNEFIEIFVEDTGIGIPENRINAIFDRFVQADIEDVKVYEGTGLGLSISKAYAELLGGNIWVDSVVNKGSRFYFTIPFDNVTTEDSSFTPLIIERTSQEITKKLSILIVEDEEIARDYLGIILELSGANLLYAKNGVEAVEINKNNPNIDVILMDIKMPLMSGYEATKIIRETNKEVIIIAQTAYALAGDKEKAIEAGCSDYISKPIDREKLLDMIGTYFN